MSEREPVELVPGTVFEFEDLELLHNFENAVGRVVDPEMTAEERQQWSDRQKLQALVKPEDFYGRLEEITLEVMEEPYQRMIDAIGRGWKFKRGTAHNISSHDNEYNLSMQQEYLGFLFSALARSTGRGIIGEVRSELWYFPTALHSWRMSDKYYRNYRESTSYAPIIRHVAYPKIVASGQEKTEKDDAPGRHIAYELGKYELLRYEPV
jgi:hypothetical protein